MIAEELLSDREAKGEYTVFKKEWFLD